MKYQIRVKTPSGNYKKKKEVEQDGKTIVMLRDKKFRPEWKFTFNANSIQREKFLHFFTIEYIEVLYRANQAISLDYKKQKHTAPYFDVNVWKKLLQAKALQFLGTGPKTETPLILYAIAGMLAISLILTFLMGQKLGII